MTPDQAREWFAYTDGTEEQIRKCVKVRTAAAALAEAWVEACPDSADQTYCLRKLKDTLHSMMGGIVKPLPTNSPR